MEERKWGIALSSLPVPRLVRLPPFFPFSPSRSLAPGRGFQATAGTTFETFKTVYVVMRLRFQFRRC